MWPEWKKTTAGDRFHRQRTLPDHPNTVTAKLAKNRVVVNMRPQRHVLAWTSAAPAHSEAVRHVFQRGHVVHGVANGFADCVTAQGL